MSVHGIDDSQTSSPKTELKSAKPALADFKKQQ
jgi:hypothetical protein